MKNKKYYITVSRNYNQNHLFTFIKIFNMKKYLSCVAIIATSFTFAQISYGAKAGLNLATLKSNDSQEEMQSKSVVKPFFGVYLQNSLNEKASITGELQLNFLGTKVYLEELGERVEDYNENLTEITLPITYNYNITPSFSMHAGGYLGFIISGKETDNIYDETYDISTNTMDYGLIGGLSYRVTEKFGLQARYNFGVADIENKQDSKWMNRFLQVGVFYNIK